MTIDFTARIHHWLNVRVAHHLAAQAAGLSRRKGRAMTPHQIPSRKLGADGSGEPDITLVGEELGEAARVGTPESETQTVRA